MYKILISLAAGGFVTSFIEYKLKYNLVDYVVEGVKRLFGKASADASSIEKKLK